MTKICQKIKVHNRVVSIANFHLGILDIFYIKNANLRFFSHKVRISLFGIVVLGYILFVLWYLMCFFFATQKMIANIVYVSICINTNIWYDSCKNLFRHYSSQIFSLNIRCILWSDNMYSSENIHDFSLRIQKLLQKWW